MRRIFRIVLALVLGTAAGCGGGVGTSTGNPTTPKAEAFPAGLAVASPFETVSVDGAALLLSQAAPFVKGYADAASRIEVVLDGTTFADCRFDPALLSRIEDDADCYGPDVAYENHPDYAGAPLPAPQADGVLPHGDVGLWTGTDAETGHACAAAQLNARMIAMRDRTLAALSALAGLLCTATVNGLDLPDDATLDLTAEVNAIGIPSVTFNEATLSEATTSDGDRWSYHIDLTVGTFTGARVAPSTGKAGSSLPLNAVVDLVHLPGASEDLYRGRLSYRIDQTGFFGNCPSADQTYNGSLLYDRSAADRLQIDARGANFCGAGTDGLAEGLVDPVGGWASNFHLFIADFNPDTLAGDYSFSWQAGRMDSNTRVLNAVLESPTEDSSSGRAFYGFGLSVAETDGGIDGFICNWAGPEADHTLKPRAQSQEMTLSTAGTFDVTDSNVTYAPVNACDYDGTGSFRYDSDGDGTIDTNAATPVTNDLVELADGDGDGIFDAFESAGFNLPVPSVNF